MPDINIIFAILVSYLIGSISTGHILIRLRTGKDVTATFSGSAGARNVSRTLGVRGFSIVFIGDTLKGALAYWLALTLFSTDQTGGALSIMAVVIGHIWPVFFKFRGGRGLSPLLGGVLLLDYNIVLWYILSVLILYILTRKLTLSGLIGVALEPTFVALLEHDRFIIISMAVLVVIILLQHFGSFEKIIDQNRTTSE